MFLTSNHQHPVAWWKFHRNTAVNREPHRVPLCDRWTDVHRIRWIVEKADTVFIWKAPQTYRNNTRYKSISVVTRSVKGVVQVAKYCSRRLWFQTNVIEEENLWRENSRRDRRRRGATATHESISTFTRGKFYAHITHMSDITIFKCEWQCNGTRLS